MLSYLIEHNRYLNLIGIVVILAIAYLFSHKKRSINGVLIVKALALQFFIGLLVLKTGLGSTLIAILSAGINSIYHYADFGIEFVFGKLMLADSPWGFIFAVEVLPVIIFFGAFSALLFHWGIVQKLVAAMNYLIRPALKTSGAETLCAVANSFLGQTEAPLLIRHYLKGLTKSEMLVVMVSGMATISGSILVVYAAMGVPSAHLLASSVMSIPGAIMMAKILYPETEHPATMGNARVELEKKSNNMLDAIASGATDGLALALNVAAMLIVFISLLAMFNGVLAGLIQYINYGLSYVGSPLIIPSLSLNTLFAYFFSPFGFLLGFTGKEMFEVGQLLGTKVALNELIAYKDLLAMHASDRMVIIMTYVLAGFSNFSSIGIQIGGIGALVPEKRHWLTELGLYAVLGGVLSNLLTAMIAGLLI